jgi:hypothetical protein
MLSRRGHWLAFVGTKASVSIFQDDGVDAEPQSEPAKLQQ